MILFGKSRSGLRIRASRPLKKARLAPLLLVAAALSACGQDAEMGQASAQAAGSTPVYGDTFIPASIGDISGLIPNITSDVSSSTVGGLIYDGLVKGDRDQNIVGELAESWQYSPDCLELTFRLRQNVKWHDGRPFTAEDASFTYETMIDPKTPSGYKDSFRAVESAQVIDPYTIRFRYKQPYAKALISWTTAMLPKHLLEPYVKEGRLREAPQNQRSPVGTGPYRFQEWKSGEKVVLVANPEYHGGRPYLSRVVYRVIPSQATIFLELQAKGVDAVGFEGYGGLTAIQYKRQTDYPAFRKAYTKYRYPANSYTYFGLNLKDPRFADRRVRQAFAHAIDKQELIDGVMLGLGREATGPYKPGSWAYHGNVHRYAYDPARARALLAQAGWIDSNGDGVVDRDGKPFTFEILTNQGNDERRKVAEIIQASLRQIGVATDVRILEWANFLKEYVKKRRFEALILGWTFGLDPDQYEIWHSSKTGPDDLNHISYANPVVDELLEKGRASCVQQDRVAHYRKLQEIFAVELPVIFLHMRDALPAVTSRIRGIEPAPAGIDHNFTEWFVPEALQRYTAG
jgi:peptide/nickel transport system substrate-binding protein